MKQDDWTGDEIRRLRERLGVSQVELARRLGVDGISVSRWERGVTRPSRLAIRALDHLRRLMM